MTRSDPPVQLVVPAGLQDALREWLGQHGRYLFLIPDAGPFPTYGIGPDGQGIPYPVPQPAPRQFALAAPDLADPDGLPVPRYEVMAGIRPPNKHRGRVRGVIYEVVQGGRVELHSCQHDHAPGVKDVRQLDDSAREAALLCAEAWAAEHIASSGFDLPVVREAS